MVSFLKQNGRNGSSRSWNFLEASCIISSGDKAMGKRWRRIRKRRGSRTWEAINRESLRAVRDELLIRRGRRLIVFRSDGNKLFICLVLIRLSIKIHVRSNRRREGREMKFLFFLFKKLIARIIKKKINKRRFWRIAKLYFLSLIYISFHTTYMQDVWTVKSIIKNYL